MNLLGAEAPELQVNVVRPAAEGWRGEWEYILWVEDVVVLGPGALPTSAE